MKFYQFLNVSHETNVSKGALFASIFNFGEFCENLDNIQCLDVHWSYRANLILIAGLDVLTEVMLKFQAFGTLRLVDWYIFTEIPNESNASIFSGVRVIRLFLQKELSSSKLR
jgi:hypothetical protein